MKKNDDEKPKPKPLDLSLPKETHEDRVREAEITETDIQNCKNFVEDMKEIGITKDGKEIVKVSAGQARRLFNSATEDLN